MRAPNERLSVRSRSVRSPKENNVGTDGKLGCFPVQPFIPENPGLNRERTGLNGNEPDRGWFYVC